jgi:UDP-N-acetylglucosamine:LPS N-acetylglucosamine transferase
VRSLGPAYRQYDHFYVLNDRAFLPPEMVGKTYFISHSERDWRFFVNLWEAYRILRRERPHLLLSTGAGPAVPFALIGRFLFGCRIVFVENHTHQKAIAYQANHVPARARILLPMADARALLWAASVAGR